ncbi:hypothetical protein B0T17DRAFT_542587 [Bombardia bombarda]|uniref:Uncharacterized protein n=1 Tax=Bombardia bombarda TaxID=252184 RepID=A0AA39WBS9_9PEZI|nr:hypothetical protein B0T17DRAFT_542587 [Bombardia bombarda]
MLKLLDSQLQLRHCLLLLSLMMRVLKLRRLVMSRLLNGLALRTIWASLSGLKGRLLDCILLKVSVALLINTQPKYYTTDIALKTICDVR